MTSSLSIVGSGLTGPLLATILAKKFALKVDIFERSEDPRVSNKFSGRSINLALSKRGIDALKYADVYNSTFESLLIPMYGRTIHSKEGDVTFQPYGNKKEHFINSVSRASINEILINDAENTKNVDIHFNMNCDRADLLNGKLYFGDTTCSIDSPIIGADGYKSVISKNISSLNQVELEYVSIEHSYKELTIPSKNNEYQLEPNSLHIWPRRNMMMIALPNLDRSFTCTLFMKSSGVESFESIVDSQSLMSFFEENFNDTLDLFFDIENDFFNNPTGNLIGLRVPSWYYENKGLVIGDAAHATVPFYGQGMNASFEDSQILGTIIDGFNAVFDWGEIFQNFFKIRKNDADSILDLSLDNYKVMRNDVLDSKHVSKQKLAFSLYDKFPDRFIPLYTMISFTNIPYSIALERGKIQSLILDEILSIGEVSLDSPYIINLINKRLTKIDTYEN